MSLFRKRPARSKQTLIMTEVSGNGKRGKSHEQPCPSPGLSGFASEGALPRVSLQLEASGRHFAGIGHVSHSNFHSKISILQNLNLVGNLNPTTVVKIGANCFEALEVSLSQQTGAVEPVAPRLV